MAASPGESQANLLFCINRSYLPLFASCLRSITRHGGYDRYDAYVLHTDYEPSQIQALDRDFGPQVRFHFISVPDSLFQGFPESERYPRQIYYRLFAPLLLPQNLQRILYLDVDTVVVGPLGELYEMDFDGSLYIGCTHTRSLLTRLNQARLQSEKAQQYINTGVLMMNLPLLRQTIDPEQISRYAISHKYALILPDQDILTALYGDRVKLADPLRFNLSDRILGFYNASHSLEKIDLDWVRKNTSIVHYCGRNKPWTAGYSGTLGTFYRELYEK